MTPTAQSKLKMKCCPPVNVTVVFAMYHEIQRLAPVSESNPDGQDFIRNKIMQLEWLFNEAKANGSTWELVAVDDGCDQKSGAAAEAVFQDYPQGTGKVLYLQSAIDEKVPMFSPLNTTKDSRKGGAILYGLWDTMTTYHTLHLF